MLKCRKKWPWRGTRVKVPKPIKVSSLTKFAVTSPYLFTLTHFKCKLRMVQVLARMNIQLTQRMMHVTHQMSVRR
ncbi:hypothetical protein SAMN05660293_01544 [Dyadobacter psychrophilus]|uniref:Uncharacterized protein n=1 Tax=Dyadobacter psychrophilus TaxID=651661 RepID=A0A1T5DDA8_9BACT|nr:hypothetical protein SAMN05660293_01544 [Dyadobacter psychrophilus]